MPQARLRSLACSPVSSRVTDAELVCLAVAQVLLRYDDERHWLRAATSCVGHLFPGCCGKARTTSG